ncbi:helix-turn-helix domain-containing protein [Mycobacterium shimoidei]|uniref:helix-turn-helix domain-containing protein n=1 Tax=Mycobacterium shimoidei TaxID=29313 RepID=UPI000849585B|nr:helix-turn-helix transcriptional regulator [Mycobacterium shimoidei]MCV7260955.1 helix-turn-helix transcriptional regulator [Mycobacterium shimoidei]ODR13677.1 transcriptional regulator [Mycobacterium shimoidei]ORW76566.1 XRE family transcriptional regulator [Mycobacterium shimoidei]
MTEPSVGALLREWRARRRVSQLDLSLGVGVSARHLSFIETGRSRPSAEMVLALADGLDIPLRERNTLLLAAGYAPRYQTRPLDDDALTPARSALQRLLDAHHPYPGVVIDRCWNIVQANAAASAMTAGLPQSLLGPPANVYRICLHPDGLAGRTLNFDEWAAYLVNQLRRTIALTGDATLQALHEEVLSYPGVKAASTHRGPPDNAALLIPFQLEIAGGQRLSMFTTLTTFGTPLDVTLDELAVELFYPVDSESAELLRNAGASAVTPGGQG